MPKIIDDAVKQAVGPFMVNVEQFNARVGEPNSNGCMEWTGPGWHAQGYGMVMIWNAATGKRTMGLTHRLTYMMNVNANLTRKEFVIHKCSNHRCCNPDHLVLGSAYDREQYRKLNKGVRNFKGPSRHLRKQANRTYKYTDSQLVYGYYHTLDEIQTKFGISRVEAYKLKHMTGPKGFPWVLLLLPLYDTEGVLK